MKFNEKIVRLRKIRGITQDELASAVGVSRQAVYKWESGQSYPEVAKLLEIKLLFNISIDDLLDDSFEIAMPEKKKRKRAPKPEAKKPEAAPAPAAAPAPVAEEPVAEEPVAEEPAAPVAEEKAEAPVSAPAAAEIPTVKEEPEAPVNTPAPTEAEEPKADEKKRGFFGRLFGRK